MVKLFKDLFIEKQRRGYKLPKVPIEIHHGYDTETFHGKAYLICNEDKREEQAYLGLPFDISQDEAISHIVTFLLKKSWHRNEQGMNWFYNLDYDIRAIIKWLPEINIRELYNTSKTEFNGYKFSYLPSKVFTISHNKHSTSFFDIAQFYGKSLDYNARKYLNSQKIDTINSEKLGRSISYWEENYEEVVKYCRQDASLTAKLGKHFYDGLWDVMQFTSKKPYSTGSIAQQYFLARANIPTTYEIDDRILELHQDGYRGGRIELLQRGYFPSCNAYDIKSAYPSIMVDLLDYSKGEWIPDTDGETNIPAGIYRVNCEWYHPVVAPFPVDTPYGAIYPNGKFETIINEAELAFIRKYDEFGSVEILEGYSFNVFKEVKPYNETIRFLFEQKEKSDDDTKKLLYKLFINSIYGKTAQAIDKRNKDSNEPLLYHTGTLWNPIYANRITSLTRLKLIETAMPIIDDVIAFATDSIHTTAELKVPNNPKLGDFTVEYQDEEGIFLMAGLRIVGKEQKVRGFGGKLNLRDVLKANPSKTQIPVMVDKPITIGQALKYKNLCLDDMNVFIPQRKILNINGDLRRGWYQKFKSATEVFRTSHKSTPKIIGV